MNDNIANNREYRYIDGLGYIYVGFIYNKLEYIWFIQDKPRNSNINMQPFKKIGYVIQNGINGHCGYGTYIKYIENRNQNPRFQHLPQIPLSIQPDGCGTVHICKYIYDGHPCSYTLTACSISYLFKIMIKRWRNKKLKKLVEIVLHKNIILKTYDGDNSITNHILEYVTIF